MTTALSTPARMPGGAELAAAGYLAQYRGRTLVIYSQHLRILFGWCASVQLDPLDVRRVHLDLFRHYLERERQNGPGTVAARLRCVRSFYRYAAEEGFIDDSPARRLVVPRVRRDETRLIGLSREEVATLLAAARDAGPERWALVSLLALLGLRVGEACDLDVEDTRGEAQGYRTLRFVGKGAKPATMPLTPPVAAAVDAAAGGRTSGPLILRPSGTRLTRISAYRWIRALGEEALGKHVHPHVLRHAFVTLSLDAGASLRDVQIAARHADPRMTAMYDRARGNLQRHAAHLLADYVAAKEEGSPTPEPTRRGSP